MAITLLISWSNNFQSIFGAGRALETTYLSFLSNKVQNQFYVTKPKPSCNPWSFVTAFSRTKLNLSSLQDSPAASPQ